MPGRQRNNEDDNIQTNFGNPCNGSCEWPAYKGVIELQIQNLEKTIERLEADLHATQTENRRLTSRLDVSEGKALIWSIIGSSFAAIVMKFLFDKLSTH